MATSQKATSVPSGGGKAAAERKPRSSWSLDPPLHDFVVKEARRLGSISANAALNVLLTELIEWRTGKRRFHEPPAAAQAGRV